MGGHRVPVWAGAATAALCLMAGALMTTRAAHASDAAHEARIRPSVTSRAVDGTARGVVSVTVGAPTQVHPIPSGFIGLSLEYYEIGETLGTTPRELNPVFASLVHRLDGDQRPNLRIGGESADWSWVRTSGVRPPAPVNFVLTRPVVSVLAATARELNARYMLDLDLAADIPRLIGHEGWTLYRDIGRHFIGAEEIGNEPELYASDEWSRPPLTLRYARTSGYDLEDYAAEFNQMAGVLPPVPTAGPAVGNTVWATGLAQDATAENRLSTITIHRYALARCGLHPDDPAFPTVAALLAPGTATTLADSVQPVVDAVHPRHLAVRVDEVNSSPCFGVPGVSNTFASALWSLQTSFALAATGVDGINFHTEPAAAHRLFNFWQTRGTWHGTVFPEFYGLMMFNSAAPAGSRLLTTTSTDTTLSSWATQTHDMKRVVLVNTGATRTVNLHVAGTRGPAQIIVLEDRSPYALSGETIGGVSFAPGTTTGQLTATPQSQTLKASASGAIRVRVAADSAALVSLVRR